jgi:hypothetical protein
MNTLDFIIKCQLYPLFTLLILLGLNEYRLFKIGSLEYKEFINGLSMLFVSLIMFVFMQICCYYIVTL